MIDERSDIAPEGVSTLHHYLRAVWRRKWVFLAPLVLLPLVTFVSSHRQAAVYEATADVLVNRQEAATTSLIGQTPVLDDVGRTMDTQVMLARVPLVVERVLEAADVTEGSAHVFLLNSNVYPLADVLRFTVSDSDPDLAVRLVGEYARQFVRYRRELDTAGLARAIGELEAQIAQLEQDGKADSPQHVRLADRVIQLESLEALETSNVLVVETPRPGDAEQVAPRPLRNTALALAGGLVAGLILVFLWETLSTRPRSSREIEALLGMPFLGRLGLGTRTEGDPALVAPAGPGAFDADAIHALRTNLELANKAVNARTIMVTSLRGGEGKSETAANLAVALARAGRHVALVDLDFRAPSLAGLFGLDDRVGLTTLARGECELADVLCTVELGEASSGAAGGVLDVVPAGPPPPQPAELLASDSVVSVLEDMRARARFVIVDVPPLLDAADAAAVSAHVDGLLLVVDARRARRPALAQARGTIDSWQVAGLGFALTERRGRYPHAGALRRAQRPSRQRVVQAERLT